MNITGSWRKRKGKKKSPISSSIQRLNSSLGEYLMAIKTLSNTIEGTNKTR